MENNTRQTKKSHSNDWLIILTKQNFEYKFLVETNGFRNFNCSLYNSDHYLVIKETVNKWMQDQCQRVSEQTSGLK